MPRHASYVRLKWAAFALAGAVVAASYAAPHLRSIQPGAPPPRTALRPWLVEVTTANFTGNVVMSPWSYNVPLIPQVYRGTAGGFLILVPLWPLVVGPLLAGLWFAKRAEATRPSPEVCRGCGYDLSGLPNSSARCPECNRSRLPTPTLARTG